MFHSFVMTNCCTNVLILQVMKIGNFLLPIIGGSFVWLQGDGDERDEPGQTLFAGRLEFLFRGTPKERIDSRAFANVLSRGGRGSRERVEKKTYPPYYGGYYKGKDGKMWCFSPTPPKSSVTNTHAFRP